MNDIKTVCDGECSTCPDQHRLFCALTFSKRANEKLDSLAKRLDSIEQRLEAPGVSEVLQPKIEGSFSPQASPVIENKEDE